MFPWQPTESQELISRLEENTDLKRGKALKTTFPLTTTTGEHQLVSWKFNEWDYGKSNKIQLPTHARGLFTIDSTIVVRGYDKFFNVGEVPMTKWDWLQENTEGPYTITAKENGCIVFFSGLEDGTVVVCSKHSYGARKDIARNHATAGEEALVKQLEEKGITMQQFGQRLYGMNCTAVAEYCDDLFEEHVVEYPKDRAGLYLHGLNMNKPLFETKKMSEVEAFAHEFGFHVVDYFQEETLESLRNVLEECAETGSYKGRETEGFVVRCRLHTSDDYFFKFKFEEPYLMYRQFREVTRKYITTKNRQSIKISKHKYITNKYLDFVIPLLERDQKLCDDFVRGFGIISLRQRFLQSYGMSTSEILSHDKVLELEELNSAMEELSIDDTTKFILVPIATIGCGKTTTAMTITECLDTWSIVINDDVPNGKNGPTEFIKRGLTFLQNGKKAVVLDRNNHQFRERQQIFDTVRRLKEEYLGYNTNVQFICLNFVKDVESIWEITRERVFNRGDNHQSIKASSDDPENVEKIMKGFIGRFQPCEVSKEPDSLFDVVVDLDVGQDSSLSNAKLILQKLHTKYPILVPSIPSDEQLQTGFTKALSFTPTFTKFMPKQKKEKKPVQPQQVKVKKPVYYCLSLPVDTFITHLEHQLQKHPESLYAVLKEKGRVQKEFHITACHSIQGRHGSEREKSLWKKYNTMLSDKVNAEESLDTITASFTLEKVLWDHKAMCVVVKDVQFYDKGEGIGLEVANEMIHVTVGTADEAIKPFYSNELALKGRYGDASVTTVPWEQEVMFKYVPLKAEY